MPTPTTPMIDHYAILGVSRDATLDQIKKAYRTSAMKCHPDKSALFTLDKPNEEQKQKMNQSTNEIDRILTITGFTPELNSKKSITEQRFNAAFKCLGHAYEVLADEKLKQTYDQQLANNEAKTKIEKQKAEAHANLKDQAYKNINDILFALKQDKLNKEDFENKMFPNNLKELGEFTIRYNHNNPGNIIIDCVEIKNNKKEIASYNFDTNFNRNNIIDKLNHLNNLRIYRITTKLYKQINEKLDKDVFINPPKEFSFMNSLLFYVVKNKEKANSVNIHYINGTDNKFKTFNIFDPEQKEKAFKLLKQLADRKHRIENIFNEAKSLKNDLTIEAFMNPVRNFKKNPTNFTIEFSSKSDCFDICYVKDDKIRTRSFDITHEDDIQKAVNLLKFLDERNRNTNESKFSKSPYVTHFKNKTHDSDSDEENSYKHKPR